MGKRDVSPSFKIISPSPFKERGIKGVRLILIMIFHYLFPPATLYGRRDKRMGLIDKQSPLVGFNGNPVQHGNTKGVQLIPLDIGLDQDIVFAKP